jgi:hypothetical protein
MSIEQIVQSWKSDEENLAVNIPKSPVGEELSEKNLEQVVGAMGCSITCELFGDTCGLFNITCLITD